MELEPEIFIVEDGVVKIGVNCYLIPEIKAIIDKYDNSIPALTYVYFMTHPSSPYINYEIGEKQDKLNQTYNDGSFTILDKEITIAIKSLEKHYETPISKFLSVCEQELFRMATYMESNPQITTGRDGDMGERFRILKEAGKVAESYNLLKKQAKEERIKMRGNNELGEY